MEIGRNAPCPCGSGRKYKKCCMGKLEPEKGEAWKMLNDAYDLLERKLGPFTAKALGNRGLNEVLLEYLIWPNLKEDEEFIIKQFSIFYPWSFFNWMYNPKYSVVKLNVPARTTMAELYLIKYGVKLSEMERELLEALSRKPFSFYEVILPKPGQAILLRDVLTEEEVEIIEKKGSTCVRIGDILFCRIAEIRGLRMMYACSSYPLPPDKKPHIINLRKRLRRKGGKISEEVLRQNEEMIREEFLMISQSLFAPPKLANTDGDPMVFHEIHYEIGDPETAFSRLAGLCVTESVEDLRSSVKLDKLGKVLEAEIPWVRKGFKGASLDNTLLGTLRITGKDLKIFVNSAQRAEMIRREVEDRLGAGAVYKTTVIQSSEYMMNELQRDIENGGKSERSDSQKKSDELMQIPEVRAKLAQMLAAHWKDWVDMKIPALGGKTPRSAVKIPDGRESVEALLLMAERSAGQDTMGGPALKEIDEVRRVLGLKKE